MSPIISRWNRQGVNSGFRATWQDVWVSVGVQAEVWLVVYSILVGRWRPEGAKPRAGYRLFLGNRVGGIIRAVPSGARGSPYSYNKAVQLYIYYHNAR